MADKKEPLKDFIKEYDRLQKLSGAARDLEENKHDPKAFETASNDYFEVLKNNYKVQDDIVQNLIDQDPGARLDLIRKDLSEKQRETTLYGMKHLSDILDEVDDARVKDLALSIVPIRDIDIKDIDKLDLDEVVTDYKEKSDDLEGKLTIMNQRLKDLGPKVKRNKLVYENTEKKINAIKESKEVYDKYRSIINDNKELVKKIADYRQLTYHLVSQEGRPDVAKLRESVDKYLDKIIEKCGDDEKKLMANKTFVEAVKELCRNDEYLVDFYDKAIVKPAEDKVNKFINEGNYNLKDYIKKTADAMNINKKQDFSSGVYSVNANDASYHSLVFTNSGVKRKAA